MKKKFFQILFLNILFFAVFMVAVEFCCAFISFNNSKNLHGSFIEKIKKTIYLSKIHYFNPHNKDYETRVRPFIYNKNFDKENIILMGCSFAYGDGLDEKENFGAVLSEQTKRNVINIGIRCASPRETLYILRDPQKREQMFHGINRAEYVIYTYFPPQKERLYADICEFDKTPHFIAINKYRQLQYIEVPKVFSQSFIVKYLSLFVYHKILAPMKKDSKLMTLYLNEINNEVKVYFKNNADNPSQFVILQYEDDEDIDREKLEKDGIKIINANSLTGKNLKMKEYRLEDWHPNAKAWEIIVPKLVKELNL